MIFSNPWKTCEMEHHEFFCCLNSLVFQHHENPIKYKFHGNFMVLIQLEKDFMGHEYAKFYRVFLSFFRCFSFYKPMINIMNFTMKNLIFPWKTFTGFSWVFVNSLLVLGTPKIRWSLRPLQKSSTENPDVHVLKTDNLYFSLCPK